MLRKIILVICLAAVTVSCRKDPVVLVDPDQHYCHNAVCLFQTVWQGLNEGYLFWERESVDWDSVYDAMLPVFEQFDQTTVSDAELANAYKMMVGGLIDHHMYVQVKNLNTGNAVYASPASAEVTSRNYYHANYFNQQAALIPSMPGVTNYTAGSSDHPCFFALFPGNNGKKIAYLRFRSFEASSVASQVSNGQLPASAMAPFREFYGSDGVSGVKSGWASRSEVEALIIDVRGNNGGDLNDVKNLICSLTPDRTDFGYSRVNEGLGRLDYSAWTPFAIDAHANHLGLDKKVVILADINSASCAELSAAFVSLFPHGTFIGERTYGATCPLLPGNHDMLYSGVFGDYDTYGYYVYTSNFDLVDKEYKSHEGIGFTPDIECLFDLSALQSGHDNQLERALQYIRTGK